MAARGRLTAAVIEMLYHGAMQLNSLRYLLALDGERHFARAAQACNVSQPSLSAGIAALEAQLGRRLVMRDRRFIEFTAEGVAILPWARQIVAALDGLVQAVGTMPGPLRGELRLGAIPAALPVLADLAPPLRRLYPDVRLSISSLTSRDIVRSLREYRLDAGVTYIEHEPPEEVTRVPLYRETSIFVSQATSEPDAASITWDDALSRPLCLLNQQMQNRRILDANLAALGRAAIPQATADSYVALLALVRSGDFATIMPDSYIPLLPGWARFMPFSEPLPASAIGLIVPERSPLNAMASAALAIARQAFRR